MTKITLDELAEILEAAAADAAEGQLSDNNRVKLYMVAMAIAANEFFRIESENPGAVSPDVLMALQQITTICSDSIGGLEVNGLAEEE